ncbi:MAG: sensor histidine kinase [Burkholderiales bacterium]|nr:sensor histidine kinase [Burkholderiales bacterium]
MWDFRHSTRRPRGSIRQSAIRQSAAGLPDLRSLGALARILVAANAAGLAAAMLRSSRPAEIPEQFGRIAITLEPALFICSALFYALSPALSRLPYAAGLAVVLGLSALVAAAVGSFGAPVDGMPEATLALWSAAYALLLAAALAAYFRLRERAFSPALAEARLQALQARIRPHFLFNSLNAVLTLVRREPARAEEALHDLADLFRALLADSRKLVTLADEIALTRQYLALERLRLGERLAVDWKVDPQARNALVPPMLLQPLVENAVYHGVEPGTGRGEVRIEVARERDRLRIELSNPYHAEHQHRQGNRMALANIEERLALHFDVEAVLDTAIEGERFAIRILMPARSGEAR